MVNVVYKLPPKHTWKRKIISWDTAFKKGAENDDSAAVVLIETAYAFFIIDLVVGKFNFPELIKEAEKLYQKHSDTNVILIEDKASGQSLIQTFQTETTFPVLPIKPDSDKFTRASAVSPLFESGNVNLLFGAWNKTLINQLCDFNECLDTPDDIVDAVSQVLNYVKKRLKGKVPEPIHRRVIHKSKSLKGYF